MSLTVRKTKKPEGSSEFFDLGLEDDADEYADDDADEIGEWDTAE